MSRRVISIVTPTFNSARFLDATICSVVLQPGDFDLHYHLQDGGSSDETLRIIGKWKQRITAYDKGPCIFMTSASEPDSGMYDAINKGFSKLPVAQSDLMTWINSDDLLAPGVFQAALDVISDVPDASWFGGRTALMNEGGAITSVLPVFPFSTAAFRAGQYDGRSNRPFLMQEGTFWRPSIWMMAEGLDESFRLAGDWDLWRRFAEFADYTVVDSVFAFHRKRIGQLSGNLVDYHAEIDARLARAEPKLETIAPRSPPLVGFDYRLNKWSIRPMMPPQKKGWLRKTRVGAWVHDLNRRRIRRRRARRAVTHLN